MLPCYTKSFVPRIRDTKSTHGSEPTVSIPASEHGLSGTDLSLQREGRTSDEDDVQRLGYIASVSPYANDSPTEFD